MREGSLTAIGDETLEMLRVSVHQKQIVWQTSVKCFPLFDVLKGSSLKDHRGIKIQLLFF